MKKHSLIKYMKRITIITTILLFLSISLGYIKHINISKSCNNTVNYVNELYDSTTYTFWKCYAMQSEASILWFLHIITFFSIVTFLLKLFSYWISYLIEKNKRSK